jgi:hypothetical protein
LEEKTAEGRCNESLVIAEDASKVWLKKTAILRDKFVHVQQVNAKWANEVASIRSNITEMSGVWALQ